MAKPKPRKRKKDLIELMPSALVKPSPATDELSTATDEPDVEEEHEHVEVYEHLAPEEFAKRFFGDGSPQIRQEGLPSLEWLKSQFKTKSAAIRYLNNQGHPPKVISKHLGIKYQHARNVCITPLKRGPNEDWRPKQIPPFKPHEDEQ